MTEHGSYWEKKNIWNLSTYLKLKFLRVCPYGKEHINKLVADCERKIYISAGVVITIVILWNCMFDMVNILYLLESIFFGVYLVAIEIPGYLIREKEDKIQRELLMYFSRVKHRYTACRNIANAIVDAADGMIYEVRRIADEMYYVLMQCDRKEKVREYIAAHSANWYLNMFFIQAYEASEKGNTFFPENIEYLRLDLMEEIYRKKQRQHEFAGYVFVAVTPFFLMPILKYWGLQFTPELNFFYAGTGMMLETITFIISIFIYGMISGAKEIVLFGEKDKNELWENELLYNIPIIKNILETLECSKNILCSNIRQLILRSGERTSYGRVCFQVLFLGSCSWILLTGFFIEKHDRERKIIFNEVETISMIAPMASEEKKRILTEHILSVTKQCIRRNVVNEPEIRNMLREQIRLGNESIEREAVNEIKKKLEQYRETGFSIGEILICFLCGFIISLFPIIKLHYRAKTIYAGAAYEVRQMQSVILMERKLNGITIIGLLEDMEVFAQIFKKCLQRCINSYGMGMKDALLRLKAEGRLIHESFEELADAFISVDEVGIEFAFNEVESNRRLLEKLDELEADINIEKKKDSTDMLARIPAVLVVGAYFIIPFFIYSLQSVFEVFNLLEDLQL